LPGAINESDRLLHDFATPSPEPLRASLSDADDRIRLNHWMPPQQGIAPRIRIDFAGYDCLEQHRSGVTATMFCQATKLAGTPTASVTISAVDLRMRHHIAKRKQGFCCSGAAVLRNACRLHHLD